MLRGWKFEIQLDQSSGKPIYLQIADAIINDIHSGRLKAGDALPGSRNLAQLLHINRNTVVDALNVLLIEGWLVSRERQGTFVACTMPAFPGKATTTLNNTIENISEKEYHIVFNDGHPDSKIAPVTELARAYRQIFNLKARWQMMGYGDEFGNISFRREIAQMLNHERGMQVSEHNMCITRGSQMAMYLAAQCLFSAGDYVMIENPGYKPAWKAIENTGAKLLPVSVDKDGLAIEDIISHLKSHKKIVAIYVTPHRQYPTTATLSLERRLALIRLSNEHGFTIIEDDYDNEFHFGYRPVLPLSSFPELKNYVYIGTMSKVVAPALRIGYLVSNNPTLIKNTGSLRKIIDVQGDSIMEQAVLQLIKDGTIKRHIKKATAYYKQKRDFTAALLEDKGKDKINFNVPEGGLAFWIVPTKKTDWQELSEKMGNRGIKILSPHNYSFDNEVNGLRFGYGSLTEKEIEESLHTLLELLP